MSLDWNRATSPMAKPLRCAASLRLAGTSSSSFGVSDPGHRPVETEKTNRQVTDLPRIGVAKPLGLEPHLNLAPATDGVRPAILHFSILSDRCCLSRFMMEFQR